VDLDDLLARAEQLRVQAGVSQHAMAAWVGCSQSTLVKWERGATKAPGLGNPRAARRWCQVLMFLAATAPADPERP
jgi:DNA-binding XRE family transcriptional regulator